VNDHSVQQQTDRPTDGRKRDTHTWRIEDQTDQCVVVTMPCSAMPCRAVHCGHKVERLLETDPCRARWLACDNAVDRIKPHTHTHSRSLRRRDEHCLNRFHTSALCSVTSQKFPSYLHVILTCNAIATAKRSDISVAQSWINSTLKFRKILSFVHVSIEHRPYVKMHKIAPVRGCIWTQSKTCFLVPTRPTILQTASRSSQPFLQHSRRT